MAHPVLHGFMHCLQVKCCIFSKIVIMARYMRINYRVLVRFGLVFSLALPVMGVAEGSALATDADVLESNRPETGSEKSIEQISAEMANPLAAYLSFSYQFEYSTFQGSLPGSSDETMTTHIFQAVLPFRQKNGKGFVFRAALPYEADQSIYDSDRRYPEWLIRQVDPTLNGEGEWGSTHAHTADTEFDLVYGGVNETGLILMYGLAGYLPTSSDTSNARQQLVIGPELNIGRMSGWGSYGAIMSHIFDVAEKKDKGTPDTSITNIRLYFSYGLGNGWQFYSNPNVSYDWNGDSGNKLALPLGGGFAKTMRVGNTPLKLSAEIEKYVVSTDRYGPDWLFRFTVTPVIPNKYTRN